MVQRYSITSVAATVSRWEADVHRNHLALTARAVPEGRDLRALRAGGGKGAGHGGVRATRRALDVAELGRDLHGGFEGRHLRAQALQQPDPQCRAVPGVHHRAAHGVAHRHLGRPIGRQRHRGEPVVGGDLRRHRLAPGRGGDVAEGLHVLPVADQVLSGLELLRQLRRHGTGEGDHLAHLERPVRVQVGVDNEVGGRSLGVRGEHQGAGEQSESQGAAGEKSADPAGVRGGRGGHEVQPPTDASPSRAKEAKRIGPPR